MRCRTCEYPLWNLSARQCPECGAPFKPSDFEFKVGFVQFRCPQCAQTYYGTDEKGHLEPREFDCVTCGRALVMDEMVLVPSEGVEEEQTRLRDPVPWLVRRKIGFMRGWLRTIVGGLGGPAKLAAALPERSPRLEAWWFAMLTLIVTATVASLPFIALAFGPRGMFGNAGLSGIGGAALFGTVFQMGWMIAWGLTTHVLLRLLGVKNATLGRTFEYACYSCGPCVLMMVPCLGPYLFWISDIWWLVCGAVMLSVGYRAPGWKVTLSAITFPVLSVIALAVIIAVAVAGAGGNPGLGWVPPPAPVQASVFTALRDSGMISPGGWNRHAAHLIDAGLIGPTDVIAAGSQSSGETVRIGEWTLDEFMALDPDLRGQAVDKASASLPPGVVAHRLGDVVFTSHFVDTANPSHSMVWTYIVWPDPAVNPTSPVSVTIGQASGTTMTIPGQHFGTAITTENSLRKTLGLPAIPDPSTVLQEQPAVAPAAAGEK